MTRRRGRVGGLKKEQEKGRRRERGLQTGALGFVSLFQRSTSLPYQHREREDLQIAFTSGAAVDEARLTTGSPLLDWSSISSLPFLRGRPNSSSPSPPPTVTRSFLPASGPVATCDVLVGERLRRRLWSGWSDRWKAASLPLGGPQTDTSGGGGLCPFEPPDGRPKSCCCCGC